MNFPPLQCVSSQTFMAYKNETPSTQTTKLTNLEKPPSRKPSAKIRKVTQNVDEVKIIKVPRVTKERENNMSTVSSSSYERYFSISERSEEEESTKTKNNSSGNNTTTRQQSNDSKYYDEDEELSQIIAKIEGEHISTMYDHHLNINKDKKKMPRTLHSNIKIKK